MNDSEAEGPGPWSCCLTVPSSTAACIEVPGYVGHSSQGVLTALGGQQGLSQAIRDSANLQLQLRPGESQAHPLIAEPEDARGLLLKLSRPKAASSGGNDRPGDQQVCSAGWADVTGAGFMSFGNLFLHRFLTGGEAAFADSLQPKSAYKPCRVMGLAGISQDPLPWHPFLGHVHSCDASS